MANPTQHATLKKASSTTVTHKCHRCAAIFAAVSVWSGFFQKWLNASDARTYKLRNQRHLILRQGKDWIKSDQISRASNHFVIQKLWELRYDFKYVTWKFYKSVWRKSAATRFDTWNRNGMKAVTAVEVWLETMPINDWQTTCLNSFIIHSRL